MKTIYSPLHAGHSGTMELIGGSIVPGFEMPSRAEYIRARVESEGLGPILPPAEHGMEAAARVHAQDYLDFLPTIWPLWTESGRVGQVKGRAEPSRPDSVHSGQTVGRKSRYPGRGRAPRPPSRVRQAAGSGRGLRFPPAP